MGSDGRTSLLGSCAVASDLREEDIIRYVWEAEADPDAPYPATTLEPWQMELLDRNRDRYCPWGNSVDGLLEKRDWASPADYLDWPSFGCDWHVDDLNLLVDAYWFAERQTARSGVQFWFTHPRKGTSRGVRVLIEQRDVPAVCAFIAEARQMNAERFSQMEGGDG